MATQLWPHQQAAIDSVMTRVQNGSIRGLWIMPTGTGKTRAFVTLLRRRGGKALIVVHRRELIRQCQSTLQDVYPEARVCILEGKRPDWKSSDVCIASVQTLNRRLDHFEEDSFDTVVIDEAHHGPATSWRNVIEHFEPEVLLGCTATPRHNSGTDLKTLFGAELYEYSLEQAIDDNHLVPVRQRVIYTETDLDQLKGKARSDFSDKKLDPLVSTEGRCREIVDGYLGFGEGRRAIVFAANRNHIRQLHTAFVKGGVSASWVDRSLPTGAREKVLSEFRAGKYQVLINCQILTEGYDEQSISCVIMARPTKSLTFYQQSVGRGLRIDSNTAKKDCLVLDVRDHCTHHDLITAGHLFGLEVVDCAGRNVREVVGEERVRITTEPLSPTAKKAQDWKSGRARRWPRIPDLRNYKPTHGRQSDPANNRNVEKIQRYGMRVRRKLTRGEAKYLLDQCKEMYRRFPEPATPKQERALRRSGDWYEGMDKRTAGYLVSQLRS